MAYYDRPYYRDSYEAPGLSRSPRQWSINTWIIVLNIVVFMLDSILVRFGVGYELGDGAVGPLWAWGYFSADTAILHGQVWRFISFQFLHAGLLHILFNMLMLFFFGRMVERYLGSRRYLAFYLLCGTAGPVSYLMLWAGGWLVTENWVPLIGASAGVFGVLVGAAAIAPDTTVMIWGLFPAKLRHVAIFMIFLAVYTIVFFGDRPAFNAGGEAAHLGGAAVGFLLIRRGYLLNFADGLGFGEKLRRRRAESRQRRREAEEREIDRILQKVHEQGLASLSRKEKSILQKASEQRRG